MPGRLPPHSHCLNCELPIPEGDEFCSPDCETDFTTGNKKRQRRMFYFYLIAIVAMVAIGIVTTL